MIYLTGDTHGDLDIKKLSSKQWPLGRNLTKDDYLIVLGDFGLLWDGLSTEKFWLDWLEEKPWTTLFLDGNHENHDMLDALPQVDMFGSVVGKVNDSVYHLLRGHIYNIDGHSIFVLGGAMSTDKAYRTEGKTWWPQELVSLEQLQTAWDNLSDVDYEIDYVLTHTAPVNILAHFGIMENPYGGGSYVSKATDPVSYHLRDIQQEIKFKHWYFGHLHDNRSVSSGMGDVKYTCLYEDIIELGGTI